MGSLLVTPHLSGFLFGVSALDAPTYLIVAIVLASVSLMASWLPARRAARVDPAVVLRE